MSKRVLVSFKERNKVLRISNEEDITSLKEQFCLAFNESISGLLITFQRFDSEWDCFVDIEECDTVKDGDKLKVVTEITNTSYSRGTISEASGSQDERLRSVSYVAQSYC